ncbi:MAG TPA: carboxymuconolactone decarboxylase family protein [Thermoanaerobaculia bacterium]
MPHVYLPEGLPGILGPMVAYPETEKHLNGLADALLRGPSSLTPGERETIAAYVSSGNGCVFCAQLHASTARHLLGDASDVVDEVLAEGPQAPVGSKLQALLDIANKVRYDGRLVTPEDVTRARRAGADDKAIHDTVLIAAAFSMYTRYVDGLATWSPQEPELYDEMGAQLAENGYVNTIRGFMPQE